MRRLAGSDRVVLRPFDQESLKATIHALKDFGLKPTGRHGVTFPVDQLHPRCPVEYTWRQHGDIGEGLGSLTPNLRSLFTHASCLQLTGPQLYSHKAILEAIPDSTMFRTQVER